MTETRDSAEKVEQEMYSWAHTFVYPVVTAWADRLRALRERQEKAWEKVAEQEGRLLRRFHANDQFNAGPSGDQRICGEVADALRSAREEARGE